MPNSNRPIHFLRQQLPLMAILLAFSLFLPACSGPSSTQIEENQEGIICAIAPIGKITYSLIDQTPNDEISFSIFRGLEARLQAQNGPDYREFWNWNRSEQGIYLIFAMQICIQETGLDGLFQGPMQAFVAYLPPALQEIKAYKCAKLIDQAHNLRQSKTGNHANHLHFLDLERTFHDFAEDEPLENLMAAYIRSNKSDFVE